MIKILLKGHCLKLNAIGKLNLETTYLEFLDGFGSEIIYESQNGLKAKDNDDKKKKVTNI